MQRNIAFCLKLDKDNIINAVIEKSEKKRSNISHSKIFSKYNRLLLNQIRDEIIQFIKRHNCELHDVSFECDSDCRAFAKDTGLKHKDRGHVHVLSDLVAWSNNKGDEPDGVIPIDLTSKIEEELNRIIK